MKTVCIDMGIFLGGLTLKNSYASGIKFESAFEIWQDKEFIGYFYHSRHKLKYTGRGANDTKVYSIVAR